MPFEWDPAKSEANAAKHGITFESATALWESAVVAVPSKRPGELRSLVIGKIGGDYWTAIITRREERIRLISVRRSREEEKLIYESNLESSG